VRSAGTLEFGAHRVDHGAVVRLAEDRAASDKGVGTGTGHAPGCALIPLIKAAFPPASIAALVPAGFDFGQLGYLLIALGAACIALDRFFGYSSGWIRYITTALVIERSVDEFRLDWTRSMAALQGSQPTAEQLDKLFHLCRQFAVGVRAQVEQETRAWVLEFQSSLSELERQLKSRAEDAKIPTGKGAPGGGAPGPDPQATSPDA